MTAQSGQDKIHVFPLELLERRSDLKQEVLDAIDRFNAPIGWHYLLDLVWLLECVEDLPQGSIILDAGAGNGLMQMLLVARGHRVISVDFSPRRPLKSYESGANIRVLEGRSFSNDYITHMSKSWGLDEKEGNVGTEGETPSPLEVLEDESVNLVYWRADLTDLNPLPDGCVDAMVSVSALEHNSPEGMEACLAEMNRVLKPGGGMHITISGSDRGDWFHEPSNGWCYSESSIIKHFDLKNTQSNYVDAEAIFAEVKQGDGLKEYLAPFYFTSGNNGMPWGKWNPEYFPLGVSKWKK